MPKSKSKLFKPSKSSNNHTVYIKIPFIHLTKILHTWIQTTDEFPSSIFNPPRPFPGPSVIKRRDLFGFELLLLDMLNFLILKKKERIVHWLWSRPCSALPTTERIQSYHWPPSLFLRDSKSITFGNLDLSTPSPYRFVCFQRHHQSNPCRPVESRRTLSENLTFSCRWIVFTLYMCVVNKICIAEEKLHICT